MRKLLGFNKTTFYGENNLSQNPVGILSFANSFMECDIAQGMFFNGKRTRIILNFKNGVDPGIKYIENFRGEVQCYMMESKDNTSPTCFKLKK